MSILAFTKDNFKQEVLDQKKYVLVEFMATWCPYCQRLESIMDLVSKKYKDKFTIGKIDEDVSPQIEDQYNVEIIPTLILFKDGVPGEPIVNPGTFENIKKWLSNQGIEE